MNKTSYPILGVNFGYTDEKTPETVKKAIASPRRSAVCIYTPNAQILERASRSPAERKILNSADILLPDGVGVILASVILGYPIRRRLTGIDSAEALLPFAEGVGLSLFLLGGKAGVAKAAAEKLRRKYPKLHVVGTHHGYFPESDSKKVIAKINKAAPDLLFVCLGYPRQERWIYENKKFLSSPRLIMGLGGSLDVWSGALKRAPAAFQTLGMEWLWRSLREPRRMRELASLPRFVFKVVGQKKIGNRR